MILINCVQGSPEWLSARAGVITASKFRDAVDCLKSGAPSAKSTLYAAQVAIERISEEPCEEGFNSWQMKRGQELEPAARMAYEARTGNLASESGVVLTDDRLFGYSTDGLIEDDGLIEIKSLVSAIGVLEMWRTGDLSDYIHQIQGGMWLTGRKWCDFIMYAPQLKNVGKELYYRRVMRDDAFIEKMEPQLMAFAARVQENEHVLRQQAA
ncbi:lambda exonuclease family protein [Cupriavidus taiwanensis]|uniref:lambda exonuclease family protein n=1 Tax=Cupriavidus taiwanensis TaxID=164546 RepID=UPI000E100E09|nr:lambda exonuclease family protein [Cupriavidus taiwanensis]SOY56807.1 putative phage-related exodeoxyribonuclease [Cupriavidus taiwanensis]SOY90708.1 putative phage-related exodeoxyribonuclease [Cupriavidus taiwanensis]SOZ63514.1 putative phage-related exodeoxyribonuclease [Cupriavidus taiwanensis]SOZ82523.1 putative phage-related exodeoxyribonuclease [Cupriavidus taiwanensis]SOZ84399.1 putative phage-related exodeoxyribonuclease [Cupriavidus taiwanensis]